MNSANYVANQIAALKQKGIPYDEVAWQAALMCVGWPYVFGARGQYCTPSNRRSRYNGTSAGKDKDNIKSKCRNFDGGSSAGCVGCQWYPNSQFTRIFDCRGFTYWILMAVYNWELQGVGCASQWNNEKNWKAKGAIADGIPADTLVCLFYRNPKDKNVMDHTGLAYNGETVECSGTVIYSKTINKKWEYWAVPACVGGDVPVPAPTRPTLRRGSSGEYVTWVQTKLIQLGYNLQPYGADGKFGAKTEAAVKDFQRDHDLNSDGIVGPKTYEALDSGKIEYFTVTVKHVSKGVANSIITAYGGTMTAEEV